jgi:hypothetical protein
MGRAAQDAYCPSLDYGADAFARGTSRKVSSAVAVEIASGERPPEVVPTFDGPGDLGEQLTAGRREPPAEP